ncbi:MAG: Cof-type HAD-IIB family hydrolase [Erysipelotrichaceae bacterium]|nr:Cof-type HAD-IIB family hydrolase [Erysipelotrichaceae bacterium]
MKALFFDIDGTLVSFKTHDIPESTKRALKLLKEKGHKIFIATGRGKDGLFVLNGIDFDGYITLNGQYCFTKDEVIYENTIKKEELEILVKEIEKNPFPCVFTTDHGTFFNYRDERVDFINSITHNDDHPVGDVSDIVNDHVYQCGCYISEEEEKELLKKLKNCTSGRWHPIFVDISPVGGTKQKGIDQFLAYYGMDIKDTIGFGDGGNDRQMLEHVNTAVVMGNGNDELKAIADYVTDDVDHDGILKALQHLKLI